MKARTIAASLTAFAVWSLAGAGQNSVRCGDALVMVGDSEPQVLAKCGAPSNRTPSERRVLTQPAPDETVETATFVETWTYDRGPSDFVQFLTFQSGRLDNIELGGYGTPR
jgi:hypothetical protein